VGREIVRWKEMEAETSRQAKTKGERRVGRKRERRTEIQIKDKRDAHRGRKRQVDKYR
jgi:hypothetical protein